MKMKTYIEMGEKLAGSQAELAKILEVKANYLSMIKSEQRGLPDALCIQLADYIKVDRLEVIAASNLITEKDEKRRKIFESCLTKAASTAGIALLLGATTLTSPTTANAQNSSSLLPNTLYYVK